MSQEYVPVDISNAPELRQLAEAVRRSGSPHALKQGTEAIAVVRPAPTKEGASRSPRRAHASHRSQASPKDDPAFAKQLEDARRADREAPVDWAALFAPPTPEQTARRKAVLAQIHAHLPYRVITPLTAADLIHEARAEEEERYGPGR